MSKDKLLIEAEQKADEIFRRVYTDEIISQMISKKDYVVSLGKITEELDVKTHIVNLEDIFGSSDEGRQVLEKLQDKEVEGFVIRDEKIIFVDSKKEDYRKRFTVAHELGHLELNHFDAISEPNAIIYRNKDSKPNSENDSELAANRFAAALLMPKQLLEDAFSYTNETRELAILFGVSDKTVSYRLKELGLI